MAKSLPHVMLSIAGAIVGGVLGYAAFFWVTRHGFYALALPGIFMGLGCGALSFGKSRWRGAACGVAGFLICVYTEWRFVDPDREKSFTHLATHLQEQGTITLILLAVGTLAAFWFGSDGMMSAWWPGVGKEVRTDKDSRE